MKILLLSYEFPPVGSGTANACYYLLKEFSKVKNINITLITSSSNKFLKQKFSNNITIYRIDINKENKNSPQSHKDLIIYTIKGYKLAKALIAKEHFDLIHSFTAIPAGLIAYRLNTPYIIDTRGSDVPENNKRLISYIHRLIVKEIIKKAKIISANSENLRNKLLHSFQKYKIEINRNGVDSNEFRPIKKKVSGFTIISTSRFTRNKGLEYLIDGFYLFYEKYGYGKLIFVGSGPTKNKIKNKTHKYKLKKQVIFYDKIEHSKLAKIYQKADIFVLPSRSEGMSNSLLEAMASGSAIIATDTGDSKRLIKNCGIIIKKDSAGEIAKAIEKYYMDKNLLKFHQKNSRKRIMSYSWRTSALRYIKYYKKIINEKD